jgi:hypothetical protein
MRPSRLCLPAHEGDRGNGRARNKTKRKRTLTRTLPPADWRVKWNLLGPDAGRRRAGETAPSLPAIRAPACRQAGQVGDEEVACLRATHRQVEEGFVGPLAELVRQRSEAGRYGGEAHGWVPMAEVNEGNNPSFVGWVAYAVRLSASPSEGAASRACRPAAGHSRAGR